jgi:ketosteroid isomerase-like protein
MDDAMASHEIPSMLEQQAASWNRGELERYLSFYAEDAVYVSANGNLLCGRLAIGRSLISRYGFTDRLPGWLSYSDLFVRRIASNLTIAAGRYRVDSGVGLPAGSSGFFSLVLRHEGRSWKILLDHPS